MQVSIIIKALNEERRIAACIEAALKAVQGLAAEIILVDSLSEDRTVAIACAYPIRIVQFERRQDRGCGAAVELGWRYTRGDYVYVLDADMQLQPGFLQTAIHYLECHPHVAGVAGKLVDTRQLNVADRQRARHADALTQPVVVSELGGGGLYRRVAIQGVGYLAHPALQAYEEAELGCRLRAQGSLLVRLPDFAVYHEGHAETNRQMAQRLWRNGRMKAAGVLLRSAFCRPWLPQALRKFRHLHATLAFHLVALIVFIGLAIRGQLLGAVAVWCLMWVLLTLALGIQHQSFERAVWRVFFWNWSSIAMVAGLGKKPGNPLKVIAARELRGDRDCQTAEG